MADWKSALGMVLLVLLCATFCVVHACSVQGASDQSAHFLCHCQTKKVERRSRE